MRLVRLFAITQRALMVEPATLATGDWDGAIGAAYGAAIARAIDGLIDVVIQVREKDLDGRALLALVRAAMRVAPRVVVNDRADIAAIAGAHGIHLSERGLPVADARRLLPHGLVGVSRHAAGAARDGADYVQLGPVFATPGKGPPLGLAGIAGAIAVGGIDSPARARAAIDAGAAGVALIRAAWNGSLPAIAAAI